MIFPVQLEEVGITHEKRKSITLNRTSECLFLQALTWLRKYQVKINLGA